MVGNGISAIPGRNWRSLVWTPPNCPRHRKFSKRHLKNQNAFFLEVGIDLWEQKGRFIPIFWWLVVRFKECKSGVSYCTVPWSVKQYGGKFDDPT